LDDIYIWTETVPHLESVQFGITRPFSEQVPRIKIGYWIVWLDVDWVSDLRQFLDDNIDRDALTRDDGSTRVKLRVLVENPPRIQVRDLMIVEDCGSLFTVSFLRAEMKRFLQYVPHIEDMRFLVKTWATPKQGVDGIKLKQKMDDEVKRVLGSDDSDYRVVSWEPRDRQVGPSRVCSTTFIVAQRANVYSTTQQYMYDDSCLFGITRLFSEQVPHSETVGFGDYHLVTESIPHDDFGWFGVTRLLNESPPLSDGLEFGESKLLSDSPPRSESVVITNV